LVVLLILVTGAYIALDFGQAYFRFYQFKDAMGQEARFATTKTDDQIASHLAAFADSLELPPGAELVSVHRSSGVITISSDYDEVIKLPFKKERVLHFHPLAVSRL
jgi:hypothetical protein